MKVRSYKNISDEAVKKATGKTWKEWFKILDKAKISGKSHREVGEWLCDHHIKSGWWSEMVTVGYEQAKGIRKPGQRSDGSFSANVSKVISLPVSPLYEVWAKDAARKKWLGKDSNFKITTANKNKNIRGKWIDGISTLSVNFYKKQEHKTQVAIQMEKLRKESDVEKMKKYWKQALAKLE